MPSRCQNNQKEVRRTKGADRFVHIFFHPDYTVGPGVSPGQRTQNLRPVADYTASGGFHPALKTLYPVVRKHYTLLSRKMQPLDSDFFLEKEIVDKLKNFDFPPMQTGRIILK